VKCGGAITQKPMNQTTVKIPKTTHRRLQKHARKVPFLKAPKLANDIITTELDRREKKEGAK
jgi:hypothetical protein